MKQIRKFFILLKGVLPELKRTIIITVVIPLAASLLIASIGWFTLAVLAQINFDFISVFRWSFFIIFSIFLLLYVIIISMYLIYSYTFVKKFDTTPEKISKAMKEYNLMEKYTNILKRREKFNFEEWFQKCESNPYSKFHRFH